MAESAVRLLKHVGYTNAGTVEFILDMDSMSFYFIEVNTRIQVEHPVTEMITDINMAEQIRVAGGTPLSIAQRDITLSGHAIECRIKAKEAQRDFMPSSGTQSQSGNHLRERRSASTRTVIPAISYRLFMTL